MESPRPVTQNDSGIHEVIEKYFSVQEVAKQMGISVMRVKRIFKDIPGVLMMPPSSRGPVDESGKRQYLTMRIPASAILAVRQRFEARKAG